MPIKRGIGRISDRVGGTAFPSKAADVGVAAVDMSFKPIAIDNGAASILAAARYTGNGREHAAGYDCCLPLELLEQLRRSAPADVGSAKMHFHAGNRLYSARAYPLGPQSDGSLKPLMVLCLEREAEKTSSFARVGLEYRLTGREQEALAGIAGGLTAKELAVRMNICPSTVKALLRVLMIKMGTPNRAGTVARLLNVCRTGGVSSVASQPAG